MEQEIDSNSYIDVDIEEADEAHSNVGVYANLEDKTSPFSNITSSFDEPNLSTQLYNAVPSVFRDDTFGLFNRAITQPIIDTADAAIRTVDAGMKGFATGVNELKNLYTGEDDDRLKRDIYGFFTAGSPAAVTRPVNVAGRVKQLIDKGETVEAGKLMYSQVGTPMVAMTKKAPKSMAMVKPKEVETNSMPVMPVNQASLEARGFDYQAGGRYINPITKEDLTGKNIGSANIKITPEKGIQGGKPQANFTVKDLDVSEVGSKGSTVVTNLIKPSSTGKKAGWKFVERNKEIDENINTLIAVVQKNKHYYTLETDFSKGVNLKTYPKKKDEPRLRPTVKGDLKFGNVVAKIDMGAYPNKIASGKDKGKPHPMAGKRKIHNLYDKITAFKAGGLVKQKGLMAR